MSRYYKDPVKRGIIVIGVCLGFMGILALGGCNPIELNYQGKLRPVDEVEEMLSDYLEAENPDLDINITIITEAD